MANIVTAYRPKQPGQEPRKKLGDRVEQLAKPFAVALKMKCLDENHQLIPGTPCHGRREKMNALDDAVTAVVKKVL